MQSESPVVQQAEEESQAGPPAQEVQQEEEALAGPPALEVQQAQKPRQMMLEALQAKVIAQVEPHRCDPEWVLIRPNRLL